ncbi:unnamed protein product, partial [Prorocentrum cordatum]
ALRVAQRGPRLGGAAASTRSTAETEDADAVVYIVEICVANVGLKSVVKSAPAAQGADVEELLAVFDLLAVAGGAGDGKDFLPRPG